MGCLVVVSVAHCAGVCSAVGAHGWNINESFFWHGFRGCVLVLVRRFVLLLCVGVWVVGNVSGVRLVGVVFGALLGPEATGPFCSNAGGHFWCFFCSCFRYHRSLFSGSAPFVGVWVVVSGGLVDGVVV